MTPAMYTSAGPLPHTACQEAPRSGWVGPARSGASGWSAVARSSLPLLPRPRELQAANARNNMLEYFMRAGASNPCAACRRRVVAELGARDHESLRAGREFL